MELTNNLGQSDSPYLKEASCQPVHWQLYSEEVFKLASEMDRPLLLDIGAVWCHWCHVMDEESYSDVQVARIINEHFVAVKVDRDQMPDVDARYQDAIGALTGAGGWPLTGFLTSEGKVFYGGTYFSKNDANGRPGLLSLLPQIADIYSKKRSEVLRSAAELFRQLNEYETSIIQSGEIGEEIIERVISDARRRLDDKFGGFGSGPKFFNPCLLDLLTLENRRLKDPTIRKMIELTLDGISRGGVFDQIGGGFHRYSVDRYWHVPHFEKMLYDNALLLKVYSEFSEESHKTDYVGVASATANWLIEEMQSESGGFYAHQDADVPAHRNANLELSQGENLSRHAGVSPRDDGSYWTWTKKEVESILSREEFALVENYFDLRESPNDTPDLPERNVLRIAMNENEAGSGLGIHGDKCAQLLSSAKKKLLDARRKRNSPFVDRTVFADRNGLAISGLVAASLSLKERKLTESAGKAAEFILDHMVDSSGRVSHSFSANAGGGHGLLEDHAYFGLALLDLFDVTRNDRYLDFAERIAATLFGRFEDKSAGGFYDRASDQAGVGALKSQRKPIEDSPTPSGNSAAAIMLDRLFSITENGEYFKAAERTLKAFGGSASRLGIFGANYASAVRMHLNLRGNLK